MIFQNFIIRTTSKVFRVLFILFQYYSEPEATILSQLPNNYMIKTETFFIKKTEISLTCYTQSTNKIAEDNLKEIT